MLFYVVHLIFASGTLLGLFDDKYTDAKTENTKGWYFDLSCITSAHRNGKRGKKKLYILMEHYRKASWQTDEAFCCASYLPCLCCPFQLFSSLTT